ncbi:hypothetical protein C8Q70DRAFT_259148 [Cubamyces menziesii]|nr:hypothetical protein C8Q70DRAFT_259148 [Cubamyces menziesii]
MPGNASRSPRAHLRNRHNEDDSVRPQTDVTTSCRQCGPCQGGTMRMLAAGIRLGPSERAEYVLRTLGSVRQTYELCGMPLGRHSLYARYRRGSPSGWEDRGHLHHLDSRDRAHQGAPAVHGGLRCICGDSRRLQGFGHPNCVFLDRSSIHGDCNALSACLRSKPSHGSCVDLDAVYRTLLHDLGPVSKRARSDGCERRLFLASADAFFASQALCPSGRVRHRVRFSCVQCTGVATALPCQRHCTMQPAACRHPIGGAACVRIPPPWAHTLHTVCTSGPYVASSMGVAASPS